METSKYNYTNFDSLPTEKDILYIDIKPNIVTYQGGLPEDILEIKEIKEKELFKENYQTRSLNKILYEELAANYFKEKYLLHYKITNCGAGNAINVNLNINGRSAMPSFCITTNESKSIMFILNNELLSQSDEYSIKLQLIYQDIASLSQYYQAEEIIFTNKNTNGKLKTLQRSETFLTNPIEMPKMGM